MTFTVEDGTGVTAANAYITEAFFDTYHTERGNDISLVTAGAVRQAAIIKATDYVEFRWGRQYRGGPRLLETQGLLWPRVSAFDDDAFKLDDQVPVKLMRAVAEYSLKAASAELAPDPTVAATVIRTREKVGPIEDEVEYRAGGAVVTIKPYPKADRLMRSVTRVVEGLIRG